MDTSGPNDAASRAQERVYEERAEEYDVLVGAEDADGELANAVRARVVFDDAVVADVGAGTGRLTRVLAERARHVHLVDRAAPMLEVARRRLTALGRTRTSIHVADARALPLPDASVDVAMAGWVFGHFRHWMPDGWRDEVDAAIGEMRRVVRPAGATVVIETLGTGHETPRVHDALEEYFDHLETRHGFERRWVRTDYVFPDTATAARILGSFFGDALAARVRAERWTRVPECTAIFELRAR